MTPDPGSLDTSLPTPERLARALEALGDRFWSKVDRKGPDECWLWTANRNQGGYGLFKVGSRNELAHRLSYRLVVGEIPDGLDVLHTCDNPPCVNPRHLQPGTTLENVSDMESKQRANHPRGEQNGRAKLKWSQVEEIRSLYTRRSGAGTTPKLAQRYGVSRVLIGLIVRNKIWKAENGQPTPTH